jgi:hypothetical protein
MIITLVGVIILLIGVYSSVSTSYYYTNGISPFLISGVVIFICSSLSWYCIVARLRQRGVAMMSALEQ